MEHITFHSELNNDFQPDNGIYSEIINHEIGISSCSSVFIDGSTYNFNSTFNLHSAFCSLHSKLESALTTVGRSVVEGISNGVSKVSSAVRRGIQKVAGEVAQKVSRKFGLQWSDDAFEGFAKGLRKCARASPLACGWSEEQLKIIKEIRSQEVRDIIGEIEKSKKTFGETGRKGILEVAKKADEGDEEALATLRRINKFKNIDGIESRVRDFIDRNNYIGSSYHLRIADEISNMPNVKKIISLKGGKTKPDIVYELMNEQKIGIETKHINWGTIRQDPSKLRKTKNELEKAIRNGKNSLLRNEISDFYIYTRYDFRIYPEFTEILNKLNFPLDKVIVWGGA